MQKPYSIDLVADLPAMVELREEWNELWGQAAVRTPYQRWEWNHAWIVGSGQEQNLFVLVARDADNVLRGISPLVRRRVVGMLQVVSFISQEASCYPDFIVAPGEEQRVISTFLNFLYYHSLASALRLKIADPSPSIGALCTIGTAWGGGEIEVQPYSKRLLLVVGPDYETYLGRLSAKMRQEIRAAIRKLEQQLDIRFSSSADGSLDFAAAMKLLFELNARRWGGNAETSHLVHRRCYQLLHENGMAEIFVLFCGDRPVAGVSALLAEKRVYLEVAGFDYDIAKVDLGKVFYDFVFRWAISRGYEEIDFSSGEEDYKFRYKPEVYEKYSVTLNKSITTKKILELSDMFVAKRRKLMRAVKRLVKPIMGGKNG